MHTGIQMCMGVCSGRGAGIGMGVSRDMGIDMGIDCLSKARVMGMGCLLSPGIGRVRARPGVSQTRRHQGDLCMGMNWVWALALGAWVHQPSASQCMGAWVHGCMCMGRMGCMVYGVHSCEARTVSNVRQCFHKLAPHPVALHRMRNMKKSHQAPCFNVGIITHAFVRHQTPSHYSHKLSG